MFTGPLSVASGLLCLLATVNPAAEDAGSLGEPASLPQGADPEAQPVEEPPHGSNGSCPGAPCLHCTRYPIYINKRPVVTMQ